MQQPAELPELHREVAGLRERYAALRQAAGLPGAEPGPLLEAAFAELDAAVAVLDAVSGRPAGPEGAPSPDALVAERRLLRAVFADAPVPLFLLGLDGTVHRANARASELLGSRPGYSTGKMFTAFVDLPSRAAVHSHLAAVARTGRSRQVSCRLLGPDGAVDTQLAVAVARLRGDADQLVVAASGPGALTVDRAAPDAAAAGGRAAGAAGAAGSPDTGRLVEAMIHRYDLVTAATRLFLENATYSESVTLQRCARLLAGELAAWVIVDVERRQRLRRQFVIGPADQRPELAHAVSLVDPRPGTAPRQVHESGSSLLTAHAEDAGLLGPARTASRS